MGNGLDTDKSLTGAPWWARLGVIFGVPTMILMVVLGGVWVLLNGSAMRMASALEATQREMIKHTSDSIAMLQTQQALVRVVQANCVNNARNEEGIRRCMQ